MPSETSNAPEQIWARFGRNGLYACTPHDWVGEAWAKDPADEAVAGYVRKDVAVPSVEELAEMVGEAIHGAPTGPSLTLSPAQIAEGVHRLLLERAACSEGDNDER